MTDLVEVASYSSEFAARLAVAQLESAGIAAKVVTDDAGGVIPSLTPLTGGARVLVRRGDADAARAELRAVDE